MRLRTGILSIVVLAVAGTAPGAERVIEVDRHGRHPLIVTLPDQWAVALCDPFEGCDFKRYARDGTLLDEVDLSELHGTDALVLRRDGHGFALFHWAVPPFPEPSRFVLQRLSEIGTPLGDPVTLVDPPLVRGYDAERVSDSGFVLLWSRWQGVYRVLSERVTPADRVDSPSVVNPGPVEISPLRDVELEPRPGGLTAVWSGDGQGVELRDLRPDGRPTGPVTTVESQVVKDVRVSADSGRQFIVYSARHDGQWDLYLRVRERGQIGSRITVAAGPLDEGASHFRRSIAVAAHREGVGVAYFAGSGSEGDWWFVELDTEGNRLREPRNLDAWMGADIAQVTMAFDDDRGEYVLGVSTLAGTGPSFASLLATLDATP